MNEWTAPRHEGELKTPEIRSLTDYVAVVRRWKWYFVVPAALILIGSAAFAWSLPPVYRSTGKILIEQQEIPSEWVQATVTSFADQRIQAISQRVLTTSNLTRVIEKFNVFAQEREEQNMEAIVQRMRDGFNIEMISAKVRNPNSGRAGVATIAFSVSFDHRSPKVAQKVASDLVSLYLEENVKTRTEAVADTTRFLEQEADRLAAQLSDMEARIAEFKEENMGQLPEQQDLNLQLIQRAEQALLETQRQIQSMEERKTYLESALAQIRSRPAPARAEDGDPSEAPTDLSSLRARYASLSGIYAQDHPDLMRLRRQIEALERSGVAAGTAGIESKLRGLRQELAEMEQRYADGHPDITRVRNEISALEQQRERASNTSGVNSGHGQDPSSIKIQAELNATESELKTLREQARNYADKVQTLERRIAETPRAEQKYRQLVRDHENLLAKYRDIRAKQSSARVAESLEEDRKGERFSLIEPPQLPQEPIEPNRFGIMMLGFAASFFGGLGTLVARELADDSVRTTEAIVDATSVPVLAVIPRIETVRDQQRARLGRLLLVLMVVACLAGGAALVHFNYAPLDILWYEQVQPRLKFLSTGV